MTHPNLLSLLNSTASSLLVLAKTDISVGSKTGLRKVEHTNGQTEKTGLKLAETVPIAYQSLFLNIQVL